MSKTHPELTTNPTEIVAEQHSVIGIQSQSPATSFQRNTHPDAQWFPEARLGLFIHWGISSVLGEGDLSWSMMKRTPGFAKVALERYGVAAVQKNISPAKYWAQAKDFLPSHYDPAKWLSAAQKAGARYAVFTTKHHDGFALWPSKFGDFNTKNYLNGRDLVGEYVEACRRCGLKVGFYYSPPDWYWEQKNMSFNYGDQQPPLGINLEPVELPRLNPQQKEARMADLRAYLKGQVEELLTHYGKVDLLWFDGIGHDAISMERIRELQPGIVVNPRAHGYGDFETSECGFPKKRWPGWWEYCHTFNDGAWGYLEHEIYKPLGWFLAEFVRARSWGGNFLPSVGPDSQGQIPEVFYKRMKQLEGWLSHSGESVFGADAGPWPEKSNVPITTRSNKWYAHADWLHEGAIEIETDSSPRAVSLLRTGQSLSWKIESGKLLIQIPDDDRTNLLDVVAIDW